MTIVAPMGTVGSLRPSRLRLESPPGSRACARLSACASRLKAIAKPALLLTCILCLSPLCFADGKVFPPVAFPANVTIPDQRALIHFTNGTERLVIETRFSGAGTNFAWVVPLPAQPVIEEATTGLFPTLQYLFRPEIKHDVPRYYFGFLLAAGFIALVRWGTRSVWNGFLVALLLIFIAGLLLPALSVSNMKSAGMGSSATDPPVSILDRRLVGIFETTTIASTNPTALQTWLRENGYAMATNSESVIADYVKEGWVFVATKVRRDKPDVETSTPHPLSFTFKTEKPVYPMRLTGVDNGPVTVELYVFGRWRAEALHFKVERCARPMYPSISEPSGFGSGWRSRSPANLQVVHPLLRKWVDGAPVATKLTATLTPAQMRKDVWLHGSPFREKQNRLYSERGALTVALNWGIALFSIGLIIAFSGALAGPAQKPKLASAIGFVTVVSLALTGMTYVALPTTPVRLVKRPFSSAQSALFYLATWAYDSNEVTLNEVRAELKRVIVQPNEQVSWVRTARRYGGRGWDNFLLGGDIQEEDSPGNFTLRESGDELEFVAYDGQGAEHVLSAWRLRRSP